MKITIEVDEWWEVSGRETYQEYDQREGGSYTAYRDVKKTFISQPEAEKFARTISGDVIISHCRKLKK